jgi:hypothetical protein
MEGSVMVTEEADEGDDGRVGCWWAAAVLWWAAAGLLWAAA